MDKEATPKPVAHDYRGACVEVRIRDLPMRFYKETDLVFRTCSSHPPFVFPGMLHCSKR